MKQTKFLMAFACLGLLLAGCGKTTSSVEESSNAPVSSNPATSQPASSQSSNVTPSSSTQPVHEHDYQAVGTAVKNADGKDVFLKECTAHDSKYIGIAFDDFSEKSADFGSTSGYNNVPEDLRNESKLLAKNSTITWKFNVDKAISNAKVAFGVVYTGSDHGTQGAADGSTMKYSVKINSGEFADWDIGSATYDDLGLSQTERAYVEYVTANFEAGENTITLRQNNAGYRLLYGGEVRVIYTGDAKPVAAPVGYTVTFAATNCKVYVYESQDYEQTPVEATTAVTRDSSGNICQYNPGNTAQGIAEVKPQVNFKVVPDAGYKITDECITISGTAGTDYNNLKGQGQGIYRITVIKTDLTVTINAVVDDGGQTIDAGKVTFVLQNCTVKVYVGPRDETGSNIDEGPDFYGRNKNAPYDYDKGDNAQFHFEIVPNTGYRWVDETTYTDGEAGKASVAWADGSFNKVKLLDADNQPYYRLTKVAGDVTLTISCIMTPPNA